MLIKSLLNLLINFYIYFPKDEELELKLIKMIRSGGGVIKGKGLVSCGEKEYGNLYGKCPPNTLLKIASLEIEGLLINEKPKEEDHD